jgi:hypothetical protein
MNAIVSGARSRSTVLTGAAGLLLLATAVVMMAWAAPQLHVAPHGPVFRGQLSSWVWVSPDHWKQVTPATVGELTRIHQAPAP